MTERLYYADSYLTQFDASVVEVAEQRLYLDRTAFYPTSGGQQHDVGALTPANAAGTSLRLVDVVDEGERVAHVLAAPLVGVGPGARVVGHVDWARRFDHMQQHTGQHLLSALFQEMLGLDTLSVHFGAEASTLDLATGSLSSADVRRVEQDANARVFENRPVTASIEADAGSAGLRKASSRSGAIRVVSIEGLDKSACGGTHVARTGEIGPILVRKIERVRKNVRLEFVCGGRATRRARADYEQLSELGALFATSLDTLTEAARSRLSELAGQASALRGAREALDEYRARELYARASERAPDADGLVVTLERLERGSLQELRGVAQHYAALPRALFVAALASPPSVLLAASEGSGLDAGTLLAAALGAHGGRGGGSQRLAQGSVPSGGALEAVLQAIGERIPLPNDKLSKLG